MARHRCPITARSLLQVKSIYSPSLSPDGKRVVFVVEENDFEESRTVSHLWMADTSGVSARQICFSYEGERAPRWSPDGSSIAFLSARPDMTMPPPPPDDEEGEQEHKEQIWVMPADGGEARRLTAMREGIRAFEWAPDSASIVFLAPEPRTPPLQLVATTNRKRKVDPYVETEARLRQQFWEILLDEAEPVLLHPGDYGIAEFSLSPDGNRIAYTTNYTGDPNDYHQYRIHVLGLQDGTDVKLVDREGGQFQARWSPDGKSIAFIANRDPAVSFSQEWLYVAPSGGGEAVPLAPELQADVDLHAWDRRGRGVIATLVEGANVRLVRIDGGTVDAVLSSEEPIEVGDFDVGPDGSIVCVAEGPAALPELYAVDRRGRLRALSNINATFLRDHELPRVEVVRWRSDDWEIEGILTLPAGYQGAERMPLVVQVHGGPHAAATCALRTYDMHAVWAAEGYAVLQPNYRGSSGYGNAFAVAIRRDLGGGDFRDILAGIDALAERGIIDPERVGIMGASYGGYLANWAACTSDRFSAAISMFGVFNLITSTGSSDIARWERDYLGAYYWEDADIYRRLSPATYVSRASTPVLIIHGEGDTNTFISNSIEMWRALKERGQTVEFARYPREGHGLREPNHRLDEMRRCLAWFDRYVRGTDPRTGPYRVGDRVPGADGYELRVLHAEDARYAGWDERRGRLLEVAIAISGAEPVADGWRFVLDEVTLETEAGKRLKPRGVAVDLGGGRYLVEGRAQHVELLPDRETGLLSIALPLAFAIPRSGGRFVLRVGGFPPVVVLVEPEPPGPKAATQH